MRIRLILLLAAIAVLAAFAALNWSEFVRPAALGWGFGVVEVPLGLLLLSLLALSWVGFLLMSSYLDTRYQLEAHRNAKALEAQRLLADKAEASRFTELRTCLESQASLAAQRDVASASRLEQTVQRELVEIRRLLERERGAQAAAAAGYQARDGRDAHVTVLDDTGRVVRPPH